jgi:hypothetical protein
MLETVVQTATGELCMLQLVVCSVTQPPMHYRAALLVREHDCHQIDQSKTRRIQHHDGATNVVTRI